METEKLNSKSVQTLCLGLAAVGLAGCILSIFIDRAQFFFSYLAAYVFFLSLALGGLFFVVLQHLTKAGWSVVIRRIAENVSANLQWFWVLILPLALGVHDLFHWTHKEVVAVDPILQGKSNYLNLTFFFIRTGAFLAIWAWLSRYFLKLSVAQDVNGDKNLTKRLQKMAPAAIILYGLSETFFSFDWIMSLNPHWFSTIFGVYFFCCSAVGIFSLLILLSLYLKKKGHLPDMNMEHYHDLGKLLFGFNAFWAYIAFSQFMLIWYANFGEETPFYHMRIVGNWKNLSVALPIIHFVIPFLFLLSRNVKRNLLGLKIGALWLFVVNYIDIYWLILPNYNTEGIRFGLADISSLLFVGGLFFWGLMKRMEKSSLIPLKDPRMEESIHFTNA